MAQSQPKKTFLETLIDQPLVAPPEGENGIGPTLGEDVSATEQEREDARHHVHRGDQGKGE